VRADQRLPAADLVVAQAFEVRQKRGLNRALVRRAC